MTTEDSKWNPSEDNIRKGFSFDEGDTAQLKLRRFTEILRPDVVVIFCNTLVLLQNHA